ncbi:flagellar biosynthesis protein FlhB [Vibrio sp. SS-MA-C1-2]|uniref:flagellar biosynthesis protein FlhB n=1 Tax=Vibrio sp. SS-MA-C1-2 TaxID=2908646 RepID=UPI001F32800C|nr:flagellar biosynthesis protein FlhB [Vibrio sp. SS-MA-C1-2]UJF18011.1 flagellar biosynthesis protein FlhB [Vibrio sp. SS-MA-C1-2]
MSDTAGDKSESASSQKLDKAKKKGQLPRAKEFTTAVALIITVLYLYQSAGMMWQSINELFSLTYQFDLKTIDNPLYLQHITGKALFLIIQLFAPLFLYKFISVIISSVILGGWVFNLSLLQPKFEKISPIAGVKRIFSLNSIVELIKNVVKVSLIFYILYHSVSSNIGAISVLSRASFTGAIAVILDSFFWHIVALFSVIIFFSLLDVPYQIYDFGKKMKMSKQELKDEHKESEGRPEIKARVRQIQMQMAQGSINKAVPTADVVLMNPTHFAVAIKYDLERAQAPYLVAKGKDEVAFYIREIAQKSDVEVLVIPELARSIFHSTQNDQMIPNQLFVAVAHVLTYVNQLRRWRQGAGHLKPTPLPHFNIPEFDKTENNNEESKE